MEREHEGFGPCGDDNCEVCRYGYLVSVQMCAESPPRSVVWEREQDGRIGPYLR